MSKIYLTKGKKGPSLPSVHQGQQTCTSDIPTGERSDPTPSLSTSGSHNQNNIITGNSILIRRCAHPSNESLGFPCPPNIDFVMERGHLPSDQPIKINAGVREAPDDVRSCHVRDGSWVAIKLRPRWMTLNVKVSNHSSGHPSCLAEGPGWARYTLDDVTDVTRRNSMKACDRMNAAPTGTSSQPERLHDFVKRCDWLHLTTAGGGTTKYYNNCINRWSPWIRFAFEIRGVDTWCLKLAFRDTNPCLIRADGIQVARNPR
ncbi:hypothetical protein BJ508DRAFT_380003 [Ascobolus immersus RN42]|uniref:Uncharacterized protein n=1 Tax=Ascobolus immersus RN42 TaxID=1160509 RepID=A0A3N4HNT5_ASCIM|nr:hypothetical protein BJ508DRAFT_380003 [Ascobolus immersus RN42]